VFQNFEDFFRGAFLLLKINDDYIQSHQDLKSLHEKTTDLILAATMISNDVLEER
jgi:hypothetical protein